MNLGNMKPSIDYFLNKLFHDLHTNRSLSAEYRADRNAVLSRYELSEGVRAAVLGDDVVALARLTNPFLLRYYCFQIGMADDDFIRRLQPLRAPDASLEAAHG